MAQGAFEACAKQPVYKNVARNVAACIKYSSRPEGNIALFCQLKVEEGVSLYFIKGRQVEDRDICPHVIHKPGKADGIAAVVAAAHEHRCLFAFKIRDV